MTLATIYRVVVIVIALGSIVRGVERIADDILHHRIMAPELARRELSSGLSCVVVGLIVTIYSGHIARKTYAA